MRRRRSPLLIASGGPLYFPNPELTDEEGLVAIGGDLSPSRLLLAYESGIFPWYDRGLPPLWWSPDPRAIIDPADLHVSRSMRRVLSQRRFRFTWNRAFRDVMLACGDRDEGTWILPEMVEAYAELHRLGHAHSIEVWDGTALAGGLYGVQRGALFAAESMFHKRTNASKAALIEAVQTLTARGIELFDVQFTTSHLVSLGAREISRKQYVERVKRACYRAVDLTTLT